MMKNWNQSVPTSITGPIVAGLVVLGGGFGGFATWASLAPIDGAVIAQASVTARGQNKAVQHLEGGIVRDILVSDGEKVSAGEPLVVLEGTAAKSEAVRLRRQLATIEAAEARTLAERDGAERIEFPEELANSDDGEIARLLLDQQAEFDVRQREHGAEVSALQQQIAALEEQIAGYEIQRQETSRQMEFVAEERQDLEVLLPKGLTRKSSVLALKRGEAELKGRQGQFIASIAEAREKISEIGSRIDQLRSARIREASAQLSELRLRQSELRERLRTADDVSGRLVVRAPTEGTVVNLLKHSAGAVVAPGQEIMTIVPEGGGLVVEARLRPQDIDLIHVGQGARVVFSAFDARQTPPAQANIVYVSADRLEDLRTGEPYYLARLEIAESAETGFDPSRIGPGHQAEVFITTGERTFFAYLLEPLAETFARSFRET